MKLLSFQIRNYKSFEDSGPQVLAPGRNVIVGINHSGKTSLLEAISPTFTNHPHRTSSRSRNAPAQDFSETLFEYELSGHELKNILLSGGQIRIPFPSERQQTPQNALAWLEEVWSHPAIKWSIARRGSGEFVHYGPPSWDVMSAADLLLVVQPTPTREKFLSQGVMGGPMLPFFNMSQAVRLAPCIFSVLSDLRCTRRMWDQIAIRGQMRQIWRK